MSVDVFRRHLRAGSCWWSCRLVRLDQWIGRQHSLSKHCFFVDGVVFNVPTGWLCWSQIRFCLFIVRLRVECTGSKHFGPFICIEVWHFFNVCSCSREPVVKHNVPLRGDVPRFEVEDQWCVSCMSLRHSHTHTSFGSSFPSGCGHSV